MIEPGRRLHVERISNVLVVNALWAQSEASANRVPKCSRNLAACKLSPAPEKSSVRKTGEFCWNEELCDMDNVLTDVAGDGWIGGY